MRKFHDNIRTTLCDLPHKYQWHWFLSAGVILHKKNDAISGLTTAAIIWAAAAIGVATGAGFILMPLLPL